ncbi:MAG: T9SS type A sorting domain-containing protein [Flavobacteriales bacterium]|nr:T9SS type A sorting domain-containing protein [Flavobacteriales bacterium]
MRNGADDRWLPLPSGLNTVLQQVSASALDSVGTYALFDANLPTGILHRNGTSTAWTYPSPASEFVEVVSATAQFNGLTVLDMTGRIVHTYRSIRTVRSYRLDLEGLAPGTYHVVLNDGRSLRFIRS